MSRGPVIPGSAAARRGPGRRAGLVAFALLLAAAPVALLPAHGSAQEVRGTAVDEQSGEPIEGGIVTLVTPDGTEVRSVLTDDAGAFRLRAPAAGRYSLKLERIGLRTWTSDPFDLAAGRSFTTRIEAPLAPVALTDLRVEAESQCRIDPEAGMAAATLWEEARKALKATAVGERGGGVRYRAERYERMLGVGLGVLEERSWDRPGLGARAFASLPAGELADDGYVRRASDGEGGWNFYAPDAEALLSDAFIDTHCFRVAARDDALWDSATGTSNDGPGGEAAVGPEGEGRDLVGLAFEPVGSRQPDIEGVLWLDRESSELSHLEFRYVNLDLGHAVRTERLGGRIAFRRLPRGGWIVEDWWIRMPRLEERRHEGLTRIEQRVELSGYELEGGRVVEDAVAADGAPERPAGPILTGFVYDSTQLAPLEGATVMADGSEVQATTGENGHFRLVGLDPGPWRIRVDHPKFRVVGMDAYREVTLAPRQTIMVSFFLPSVSTLMRLRCPEDRFGTAAVVGMVKDDGTGEPVHGARVELTWGEERVEVYSDESGWYRACALPTGTPISVVAEWQGETRRGSPLPPISRNGLRKLDFEI